MAYLCVFAVFSGIVRMDLAWCIICDNRIDDGQQVNESSLYCSESCQMKDLINPQPQSPRPASPLRLLLPMNPNESKSTLGSRTGSISKLPVLRNRRAAAAAAVANSSAYPWVPLYRRRRGVVIAAPRRCQPIVASSFTSVSGFLSNEHLSTSRAVAALIATHNVPLPTCAPAVV